MAAFWAKPGRQGCCTRPPWASDAGSLWPKAAGLGVLLVGSFMVAERSVYRRAGCPVGCTACGPRVVPKDMDADDLAEGPPIDCCCHHLRSVAGEGRSL
jgi:hypothetical protein